jgi:hypothetical protein
MQWKRITLFSLFFLILVVSLFCYMLSNIPHPLRNDPIPGSAYVVPWMRASPSIDELNRHPQLPYSPPTFNIDLVMANALKLDVTFRIDTPSGTRIVPSTVYLGHDSDHLYIGGKFIGMRSNPLSGQPKDLMEPNVLDILFDVNNDGILTTPESGSRLAAYVREDTGRAGFMSYNDMLWCYIGDEGRASWTSAYYYYSFVRTGPQPAFGVDDMIAQYDNSTGTLMMLFERVLDRPATSEFNTLQMRPGERWVMGFLLETGYEKASSLHGGYMDGWPKNAYPYLSNDASWWPKLAIDLTNPPSEYSDNSQKQV